MVRRVGAAARAASIAADTTPTERKPARAVGLAPVPDAVIAAVLDRRPAIAAAGPALLQGAVHGPADLARFVHLGQELTVIPTCFTRPITVAKRIAEVLGGEASTLVANQRAQVDSPLGTWIVELDGKMPGGAPIIEVGSPPVIGGNDDALLAVLSDIHGFGEPLASVGGGHIHVDGAPFLASSKLLSRFLQLYVAIEPALLSVFRHPARSHAARGLTERVDAAAIAQGFAELGDVGAGQIPGAMTALLEAHGIDRNSALNLLSLAGVAAGNKKSKGTIELRLFDSPIDLATARRQRKIVRMLLAAAFGSGPVPGGAVDDLDGAEVALTAAISGPKPRAGAGVARVPPGPWSHH